MYGFINIPFFKNLVTSRNVVLQLQSKLHNFRRNENVSYPA